MPSRVSMSSFLIPKDIWSMISICLLIVILIGLYTSKSGFANATQPTHLSHRAATVSTMHSQPSHPTNMRAVAPKVVHSRTTKMA